MTWLRSIGRACKLAFGAVLGAALFGLPIWMLIGETAGPSRARDVGGFVVLVLFGGSLIAMAATYGILLLRRIAISFRASAGRRSN